LGDLVQGPLPPEPEEESPAVYGPSEAEGRLWQGEILENLIQLQVNIETIELNEEGAVEVRPVNHELVLVLSQDCDLEQDYKRRQAALLGTLPNILFCEVYRAEDLRARVQAQDQLGRQDWKRRIAQNQNDRFQYLQRVEANQDLRHLGLPALAIDFKIYFTVPSDELYFRLRHGILRRSRLNSPYIEHLAYRFYKFQSRIALPRDHAIDAIPE